MCAVRSIQAEGLSLWRFRPARDAAAIAGFLVLLSLLHRFGGLLMPVFAALILSYVIQPAVKFFRRRFAAGRVTVIALILLLGGAAVILAGIWLVPLMIEQGYLLLNDLPGYRGQAVRILSERFGIPEEIVAGNIGFRAQFLLDFLGDAAGIASRSAFWLSLLPFFLFFFAWRFPAILRAGECLFPPPSRRRAVAVFRRIDAVAGGFFRGRLLAAAFMGVMLSAGWLAVGVPYWFLLGIITGLLGIAPYLSIVGWIAAVSVKYLQAGLPAQWRDVIAWPSVVFLAANIVEEWMLIPWIQSKSVNLSPVTIVLAVIAGGAAGGVVGLLFAIPVAGIAKVLCQEFIPVFSPSKSQ